MFDRACLEQKMIIIELNCKPNNGARKGTSNKLLFKFGSRLFIQLFRAILSDISNIRPKEICIRLPKTNNDLI